MLKNTLFPFVVLLIATTVIAGTQGQSSGVKVIGGENAKQGEFPYVIAVNPDAFNFSYCGGALVQAEGVQLVITSAKCAQPFTAPGFDLSKTRLVGGDISLWRETSGREQIRRIRSVHQYPEYESIGKANDIAILTLDSEFDINEDVSPIALPQQGQTTTGDVILTGFGGNKTFESGILAKIQVPLVDAMDCMVLYGKTVFRVQEVGKLCAKSRGIDGPNHCDTDMGSPVKAVNGDYLAGIVIYPESCRKNLPCLPDVYTDVAHYVDWIHEVAKLSSYLLITNDLHQ